MHITTGTLKISHETGRSIYKFSCKSGGKQKMWTLNWNSQQIFEKSIQSVKFGKRAQFE